jgi:hypothetical protein
MVELSRNNYTSDYVVVESNRRSISWFNPLRYTMALLALISALSSSIIIIIIAPNDYQFMALFVSLCISIIGIIGSLKIDLLLSSIYCSIMLLLFVIQCRYYNLEDISVMSLTVPILGWASINPLSSFARVFLQLLYCIASTAFVYALWFENKKSEVAEIVLSRI